MLQERIKPEYLLSLVSEGKFFLSLKVALLVGKKQRIPLTKAKSVPVFVTCKVERGRQHKLLALLELEVTISKSLEVFRLCGKYPVWDHRTFSFQ